MRITLASSWINADPSILIFFYDSFGSNPCSMIGSIDCFNVMGRCAMLQLVAILDRSDKKWSYKSKCHDLIVRFNISLKILSCSYYRRFNRYSILHMYADCSELFPLQTHQVPYRCAASLQASLKSRSGDHASHRHMLRIHLCKKSVEHWKGVGTAMPTCLRSSHRNSQPPCCYPSSQQIRPGFRNILANKRLGAISIRLTIGHHLDTLLHQTGPVLAQCR